MSGMLGFEFALDHLPHASGGDQRFLAVWERPVFNSRHHLMLPLRDALCRERTPRETRTHLLCSVPTCAHQTSNSDVGADLWLCGQMWLLTATKTSTWQHYLWLCTAGLATAKAVQADRGKGPSTVLPCLHWDKDKVCECLQHLREQVLHLKTQWIHLKTQCRDAWSHVVEILENGFLLTILWYQAS